MPKKSPLRLLRNPLRSKLRHLKQLPLLPPSTIAETENRIEAVNLNEDNSPIDVLGSATPAKETPEEGDDFDWDGYSERLSQKFKKK